MTNKKEIIVIIGNGFDLEFGLKSRYKDFFESEFWPFQKSGSGNLRIRKPSELDRFLNDKMAENWYNLESLLAQYATKLTDVPDVRAQADHECFLKLKTGLRDFIRKAQHVKNPGSSNVAVRFLQAIHKYRTPIIYTFNYTNLVEFGSLVGIDDLVCTHVHGSIEDNNIVLGIEDNITVPSNYNFLKKDSEPTYKSNNLFYDLMSANEVAFFGHSLGENDFHFFRQFFRLHSDENNYDIRNKCRITFFTANSQSRMDLLSNLRIMNDGRNNQLFAQNDLHFIRTREVDSYSLEEFSNWIKYLEETRQKVKFSHS